MPKFVRISEEEKKPVRIGIFLMLIAAALVLLIVKIDVASRVFRAVAWAVAPLLYGIALAYFIHVFVLMFERFIFLPVDKRIKAKFWLRLRHPLANVLSVIFILSILLFAVLFMIPELMHSLRRLAENVRESVPVYIESSVNWLEKFQAEHDLPFNLETLPEQMNWQPLISDATEITADFLEALLDMIIDVANGIGTAVVAFIFSLYLLFGKEKLLRGARSFLFAFFSEKTAKRVLAVSSIANDVFYSFIRGQLLEAAILGSLCYAGMLLFNIDYALLISAIIALGALVPIFGALVGAVIGAVILLITNPIEALWFIIFIFVLQQIEGNIIYPRVVGSSIGLPAIWTMFAVLFCGTLFGIQGVLFGAPVAAVVYRLLRTATKTRLREREVDLRQLEPAGIRATVKSVQAGKSTKK